MTTVVGALVARYRTLNLFWFKMHYAIQSIAGVLIIVGVALGYSYAHDLDYSYSTRHKASAQSRSALYSERS